jgi:uncharacterized damage-inducible protein DinB
MKDVNFINERIIRGQQAVEKFEREFSALTKEQLNWKPNRQSWSVAECLQHLLVADGYYFQDLQQIGHNTYKMTLWEKYSPFSGLFGKALKEQMKEQVKRRMTTHQKLTPTLSHYELDILHRYKNNLNEFIQLVDKCSNADLDEYIINSPTITWITYSLRVALDFLFEHEHRHLNQAIRVKNHEAFPKP